MVKKDKSTPENRQFWKHVAAAAAVVKTWPAWKRQDSPQPKTLEKSLQPDCEDRTYPIASPDPITDWATERAQEVLRDDQLTVEVLAGEFRAVRHGTETMLSVSNGGSIPVDRGIEDRWIRVVYEHPKTWAVVIHGTDYDGAFDEDNFFVVYRGTDEEEAEMLASSLASIVCDIVSNESKL
jgi:hypothetical protein